MTAPHEMTPEEAKKRRAEFVAFLNKLAEEFRSMHVGGRITMQTANAMELRDMEENTPEREREA